VHLQAAVFSVHQSDICDPAEAEIEFVQKALATTTRTNNKYRGDQWQSVLVNGIMA